MQTTTKQLAQLFDATKGQFFTAVFEKKNGQLRALNGRVGVSKYVSGEGQKFDPRAYDLVTVYDVRAKGYRMINLRGMKSFKSGAFVWNEKDHPIVLTQMQRYEAGIF